MNGKKIFWVIVAVVVVIGSFLTGLTVGNNAAGIGLLTGGDYANGYNAGMDDARKKLAESGVIPPSPAVVNSITGTVKSVNEGQLVIDVAGRVTPNPLDPQGPAQRTVITNDKTQVIVQIPSTPDEQVAAMKKFQDDTRAGKPATPPTPYTEEVTNIDAIKIGMVVTVTSADNIKTAATINASKIVFVAIPSTVPVAPTK